jgi:hypothetical protein
MPPSRHIRKLHCQPALNALAESRAGSPAWGGWLSSEIRKSRQAGKGIGTKSAQLSLCLETISGCDVFTLKPDCQHANAELGMCNKCAELDRKIEHYERMRSLIGDQLTVDAIKELVAKLKAEKAELHPE